MEYAETYIARYEESSFSSVCSLFVAKHNVCVCVEMFRLVEKLTKFNVTCVILVAARPSRDCTVWHTSRQRVRAKRDVSRSRDVFFQLPRVSGSFRVDSYYIGLFVCFFFPANACKTPNNKSQGGKEGGGAAENTIATIMEKFSTLFGIERGRGGISASRKVFCPPKSCLRTDAPCG